MYLLCNISLICVFITRFLATSNDNAKYSAFLIFKQLKSLSMYHLFSGGSQLEKQLLRCTFHGKFHFSESEPIHSSNITSSNSLNLFKMKNATTKF